MRLVARPELLERYRALPLPTTKDEAWRFTDLAGFDPEAFAADGASAVAAAPTMLEIDAAGLAQVSEAAIQIRSAPESIRFEPLADHPLLGSLVGADEKFAAHNAAMWEHGLLVHVPNAVVEIAVEQGAKVEYVSVQNLSWGTWHFGTHHARVERDAELDWVTGGFGSKKGKIRIQNDLAGPGATSRVTGAYFADGAQHLDYDTFQEHIAPSTTSDFAFKGALRDKARTVWRGMIRVGEVDRDQLFYLMTRGLDRAEAERLIVRGFFQDVLDRVELEPVREALAAALEARIPQA